VRLIFFLTLSKGLDDARLSFSTIFRANSLFALSFYSALRGQSVIGGIILNRMQL